MLIKLETLSIRNFKGQPKLDLDVSGGDLNIYGDNGTGKTTVADALTWLLFGKDTLNRADFEIKPLDAEGNPNSGIKSEVEATFRVGAYVVTLKRSYAEVWRSKRGSIEKTFGGHTTDYFIDGVPCQEKEYVSRVFQICSNGTFQLLSDPRHFADLKWQDRRRVLIDAFGDITDDDVIASDKRFAGFKEVLNGRSIEDAKKVLAAQRKTINDEIKAIPERLDELSRSLGDLPNLIEIEPLEKLLSEMLERRSTMLAVGDVAEKRKTLTEMQGHLASIATAIKAKLNEARDKAIDRQREVERNKRDAQSRLDNAKRQIASLNGRLTHLSDELEDLRSRYSQRSSETLVDLAELDELCPTCGQTLPENQIEAIKTKRWEKFNGEKAEDLRRLKERGSETKEALAKLKQEEQEFVAQVDSASAILTELDIEYAKIEVPPLAEPDYRDNVEYAELDDRINALKAEIESTKSEVDTSKITDEINAVKAKIAEANQIKAAHDQAAKTRDRMAELKAEQKKLAEQYEAATRNLHLIEEFVRAKVWMLTGQINDNFDICRFKLFDEQVNGALVECCEITVDGVPYGSLNHGSRINAGLEIIDKLAQKLDVTPFVIIDNAESVTAIRPTAGQQIRLIVSATDKELRIETRKEEEEKQGALI